MKKLTVAAMKQDSGAIMRKLLWLGAVQVSEPELPHRSDSSVSAELESAKRDAALLREAMSVLGRTGEVKRGLFAPLPRVTRAQFEKGETPSGAGYPQAVAIADKAVSTFSQISALKVRLSELASEKETLTPWLDYPYPLSETSTRLTSSVLGTLPLGLTAEEAEVRLISSLPCISVTEISTDKLARYIRVIYMKCEEYEALTQLSELGFKKCELSRLEHTALEELDAVSSLTETCEAELRSCTEMLKQLAAGYDSVAVALDIAMTAIAEAEAKKRLFCTEHTVILSGWIPQERIKELCAELGLFDCYYTLDEPSEEDEPPVLLKNRAPASYFETVVGLYSYPRYGSLDPTFVMMIFFFAIFGMMLADVVYGLVMLIGCAFIVKKTNLSRGVKEMCCMFGVCGISCIIWGVLFGSYLGDLPAVFMKNMLGIDITVWAAVDIMTDAMLFLILSLSMGALHMLTGMAVRAYMLARSGHVFSAIFDEGSWFVLFGGIGLVFLNSTVGTVVIATGVLMLILTQGRNEKNPIMKLIKGIGSLYSLVNYVSDLLSYSRIMALGLSSAVVASVFNTIATMMGSSPPGIVLFVIVLPLGHLLNLALNLLGTFVHTSRLQYIEFFGKFFEDGGKQFEPLTADITHCSIVPEPRTRAE